MLTAANDEVWPAAAGVLFPGIPARWANLPTEIVLRFRLTERGGVTGSMFEEYRRDTAISALDALVNCRLKYVMLTYAFTVRGATPMLAWDLDAPLTRLGRNEPHRRAKAYGGYSWDDSLLEVYQYSRPVGFVGSPGCCSDPSIRLRVGGRTPQEAVENWATCAKELRCLKRLLRKEA